MALKEALKTADDTADPGQTICFCHNVTRGQLLAAIAQGAVSLEAIQLATCASTGCGGCHDEVLEILAKG